MVGGSLATGRRTARPGRKLELGDRGVACVARATFADPASEVSSLTRDSKAWEQALLVASAALAGSEHGELKDATHYHAWYVSPSWAETRKLIAVYEGHWFYE